MSSELGGKAGGFASSNQLGELVTEIYDRISQANGLACALCALRRAVGARVSALLHYDVEGDCVTVEAAVGCGSRTQRAHRVIASNLRCFPNADGTRMPKEFKTRADLSAAELVVRQTLQRRWEGRPRTRYLALASVDGRPRSIVFVAAVRGEAGPFTSHEAQLWEEVAPFMRPALQIRRDLDVVQQERAAVFQLADQACLAMFTIGQHGAIISMNAAARKLVSKGDTIVIRDGRVRLKAPVEDRALQAMIADATKAQDSGAQVFGSVEAPDLENRAPTRVSVMSMAPTSVDAVPQIVAVVTGTDLKQRVDHVSLRAKYRLTPTEARLASLIAGGFTIREAASQLDIGVGTTRNHLKRVFEKTGNKRQAELVRLLLSPLNS